MSVKKIYVQTLGFVWMKLGLGLLTVVLWSIIMGSAVAIGLLFDSMGVVCVFGIIGLILCRSVSYLLNHYIGYLVKVGHVAIIAQAVTTGQIPEHQFASAKDMVKERFVTSNVYFVVDKLVSRSVSQIQGILEKGSQLLGDIPGIGSLVSILQLFVKIALNYVDECCVGYTFIKKEDSAFKSAADGVVIYAQNWKVLLKNAAKTTFFVIIFTILSIILPFILFGAVFSVFSWPKWIAFILALLVALCVKDAFIDSYMLIRTMVSYMQVAPTTVITFDLYGKLCGWSKQFKELFGKAKQEDNGIQDQYQNSTQGSVANTF